MFSFLFGKPKKNIKPTDTLSELKNLLNTITKRQEFLEKIIESNTLKIKEYLSKKNKTQALHLLRRNKLLEKQIISLFNQYTNIDIQIMAIEQSITTKNIYNAFNSSKTTLKSINIDPDKVATVMEDINDNMDNVNEIASIMSQPIGEILNEDDLLEELNSMNDNNNQEIVSLLQEVSTIKNITPTIPTVINKLKNKKEIKEIKELAELEKLMAI
jgi:hypothetical protein